MKPTPTICFAADAKQSKMMEKDLLKKGIYCALVYFNKKSI
jgi:hypothetical protein